MAWEHSPDKKLNQLSPQDFVKHAQETWAYLVYRVVMQSGEREWGKN